MKNDKGNEKNHLFVNRECLMSGSELLICISVTTHLTKCNFKKKLTSLGESIFVSVIKSGVGGTQQSKTKQ